METQNEKDKYLVFAALAEGEQFIPAPTKESDPDNVGFKFGAYRFLRIHPSEPDFKYNAVCLNDGKLEKMPLDLPVILLM